MNAVLLDSNLIIYSIRPDDSVIRAFARTREFFASKVSIVETLGFHRLANDDERRFAAFFAGCPLIPVSRAVINHAVRLRQTKRMRLGDALIAATALVHDLDLATRNTADFRGVEGLCVVDPYEPA